MTPDPSNSDITMLRGTLAWMDLVMANIDESIFVVNKDWEIIYTNDTLVDLLGVIRVTVLGKHWWDVVPLEKDGKLVNSFTNFSEQSIEDVGKLNGIYHLKSFEVNRLMSLTASHVTSVNQTVCVLADVTMEMNAYNAIKQKDEEITRLQEATNS